MSEALFEVTVERDRHGTPTGMYIYEVYDSASGGPIEGGSCHCPRKAETMGAMVRNRIGREMYGEE